MVSPVRGLRATFAARSATMKIPKPATLTSPPDEREEVIEEKILSTARLASAWVILASLATAEISSFLFKDAPACCISGRYRTALPRKP